MNKLTVALVVNQSDCFYVISDLSEDSREFLDSAGVFTYFLRSMHGSRVVMMLSS